MQDLLDAVRSKCSPAVWSRGIELTRADAVVGERASEDEVVIRVVTRGGLARPKVRLFLDEGSWECSCSHRPEPGCEHAAAAVIMLKRTRDEGRDLPEPRTPVGRVGYRLARVTGGLALDRMLHLPGKTEPLTFSIASYVARTVDGPDIQTSQADLAIERVLGPDFRGLVPSRLWPRLLPSLATCKDLTLEGKTVLASSAPVVPLGRLEDQGDGFRLWVEDDPSVTEVFGNGVALCGDTLRPLGDSPLTGREMHELPAGKHYGPESVSDLVVDILPSLTKRIPVEIRTARLPTTVSEPPRIVLDLRREGGGLSVLPTLLYGEPPIARIDAGRMVHLGGPVPLRDEDAERRLASRLAQRLGLAPGIRSEFPGERAVELVRKLEAWDGEVRGEGREAFALAPPLVPRVRIEGEAFDVAFETSGAAGAGGRAPGRADAGAVLRAWREGASLVPLAGGGWSALPAEWLAQHGHRVSDLLAARDAKGAVPRAALADLGALCDDLGCPRPPGLDALRAVLEESADLPAAPLPDDLAGALRPYQKAGVDWLAFMGRAGLGALLADDMGLGKTLQTLCAIRGRALVVAPTSVLHNWVDEARRFRPGLRVAVYHGPGRRLDPAADVTLTTYAILRLDTSVLAGEAWDTVVLDEAQAIKNPDSQVARAAYRLSAAFRITLSGTPVENRLDELWSQLHFLNRGLLGGREDFQDRYARPIAAGDAGAAARLRERIRPFVLRRLKKEVAPELPPRTDVVLYCSLDPEERQVYDAVLAATRADVIARLESGGSVLAALEALLRLRQAACHSALVPGQHADGSSKIGRLLEALETVLAEGHKALVFSQWTSLLDRVEPHLASAGVAFARLDGSTRDRADVVRRFQDEAGPPLMLISLKAGGTGLNLTAADHVFLLDPWWNPAVEDQAADRTHRIGQDRPVMVYRIVAEDTVEERILALQEAKRALADAALEGTSAAGSLGREDLLALLR